MVENVHSFKGLVWGKDRDSVNNSQLSINKNKMCHTYLLRKQGVAHLKPIILQTNPE